MAITSMGGANGVGGAFFQLGKSLGLALGGSSSPGGLLDGFQGEGLEEFDGFPMGPGLANPMLGLGQLSQLNPQSLFALGSLLGQAMGSLQGAGSAGACLGCGGSQGGAGQTVELQKGQTFTTPGGATISWPQEGDEVKVSEPGGAQQQGRNFGAGNGINLAASFAGPGYKAALALSIGGTPGPVGGACLQAAEDQEPREWRVWGDPHIDHPNGEKSDFEKKNAIFTLQDGSQILMGADNPKAVVNRVQIVLPGGQPNWDGFDPSQTTVMQDNGKGKFVNAGTADRLMQGGFAALS